MQKFTKSRSRNIAVFPILIWSLAVLWCTIFLFFVGWGIMTSLKSTIGFYMNSWGFSKLEYYGESGWALENYVKAFTVMKINTSRFGWVYFGDMLFNTLYYVFVYAFVGILAPMLCSYVYAKYSKRLPWVKIVWVLVLISLYVPISASLGASLNLAATLGIYDNIFLFVIASFGPFGSEFLIYYAIWKGLSWEYAEAAFIDGASHWTVLVRIMFPMTATVFWVLFVTKVIALWTDYTTPMLFLPSYPTLAYGVYSFQNSVDQGASGVPIKIASLVAVALPIFILFMFMKEKMMGSLTMGGLKG